MGYGFRASKSSIRQQLACAIVYASQLMSSWLDAAAVASPLPSSGMLCVLTRHHTGMANHLQVMEYMVGGDLASLIQAVGCFPEVSRGSDNSNAALA